MTTTVEATTNQVVKQGAIIDRLAFIKAVKEAKAFTTTKSIPELEQVHIVRTNDGCTLFACNSESSIKVGNFPIEVATSNGWLRFGFDGSLLLQSVALLNEFSISITENRSINAYLVSENGSFKIAVEQYNYQFGYWPTDTQIAGADTFVLDADRLKALARLNSKTDNLHDLLGTVYLTIDQDGYQGAMTTNGHYLLQDGAFEFNQTIAIASQDLLRLPDGELSCQIVQDESYKYLLVTACAGQYLIKLKDVNCPNIDFSVIAPKSDELISFELPKHFVPTVKLVSKYANQTTKQIKFEVVDGVVKLSGFDIDFSNDCEVSLCDLDITEPVLFGFSGGLAVELIKAIKDMTDDVIEAAVPTADNAKHPILFRSGEIVGLLMPVLLKDDELQDDQVSEIDHEVYHEPEFETESLTDED